MNIIKIKELAENRAGGLKKLAKDIEMSEANLHRCINGNKIQANDLEKIASIFNVPVGYFFDEVSKAGDNAELINELKQEVERLKNIIAKEDVKSSHIFLAIPIDNSEFLDLREMKDKIIRVLNE
ncbi:MAG: helix-turn-helix domain-containing protein [Dysgonamonadaceae bacterium]|jgi:DNA-binding Xre family transcriptional regulator|nr:helix-turn-helix domain-containing protein [Dysgonamonadaceae bacterium]